MLQDIRERAQSWVAVLIIGFIVITFALWGIHNYVTNPAQGKAAVVNGDEITNQDVNLAFERIRQQQLQAIDGSQPLPPQFELNLKRKILKEMINLKALNAAANKQGYSISEEQLQKTLAGIPVFQVDGAFSKERFIQVLSDIHYTPQGFLSDIRNALIVEQIRRGFISSAFVLPSDLQNAMRLAGQTRSFDYILIPQRRYRAPAKISTSKALAYYQAHPELYTLPAHVKLQYLELTLNNIRKQIKVSDEDIKQYYDDNKASFTEPARWHIAHIVLKVPANATADDERKVIDEAQAYIAQLQQGADFAKLAEEQSVDVISGKLGGELGWLHQENLEAPVLQELQTIKSPMLLPKPIRTTYGVEIIKVLGYDAERAEPVATVHPQIEQTLRQQHAEQMFFDKREQLANLTFSNPDTLRVAADALSLPIQTSDWIQKNDAKAVGIGQFAAVLSSAFGEDVYQNHNNSQPIELSSDRVVVVRVAEREDAKQLPFAQVQDQVRDSLAGVQAKEETIQVGQDILQKANSGQDLTKLAQTYQLSVKHGEKVGRKANSYPAEILNLAFRLPKTDVTVKKSRGFVLDSGDYIVVVLRSVLQPEANKATQTEKNFIRTVLENGFGQIDYALYVQSILQHTKIKIENEQLDSPDDTLGPKRSKG